MYLLNGDLNQLVNLTRFLKNCELYVTRVGIYPAFNNVEQYVKALEAIFKNRVEGWWSQKHELIQHNICTKEEFNSILQQEIREKRQAWEEKEEMAGKEKKKINCCKKGEEDIFFKKADNCDGPEEDGFVLAIKGQYPDPAYELINYCPYCGKKIYQEEKKEEVEATVGWMI